MSEIDTKVDETESDERGGAPDEPSSPSSLRPPPRITVTSPLGRLADEISDPNDQMIGRVMAGRYKVIERVGRGGMGLVYRARQIGLERDVVVKVLAAEALDSDSAQERFMREAQALSMVNHPNIVSIYDFGQEVHQSYIVMEYVDGVRLDTLIRSRGHLSLQVFTSIARQMLEALGDAHEMGLMHRDLKPSNILLTKKREFPYYVKLLDFGLAKMLEDDSDLTGQHNLVGSMAYLSPEQIMGHDIDQRVDVYALGVLFYYMLTGTKPFSGNDTAVLYKHIHSEVPPLLERIPQGKDVPATLAALIERCLSKDPVDRPRDADALLDELLGALAGRDVLATPWITGEYTNSAFTSLESDFISSQQLVFVSPESGETSNDLSRQAVGHLSSSSLEMPRRPVIDEDSEISVISKTIDRDEIVQALKTRPEDYPSDAFPAVTSTAPLPEPEPAPGPSRKGLVLTGVFAMVFGVVIALGLMSRINVDEAPAEPAAAASDPARDVAPAAPDAPAPSGEIPEVAPAAPAAPAETDGAAPEEVAAPTERAPKSTKRTRRTSKPKKSRRAPVEKAAAPVEKAPAVEKASAPVEKASAPVEKASVPAAKASAPKKSSSGKDDPDDIMLDAPKRKDPPKKKGGEFDLVDL